MTTTDEIRRYHALLRNNLSAFTRRVFHQLNPEQVYKAGWHIDAFAHELERCERGETTRLITNMPPRHLKSICASVAFPAWVLGRDPTRRIVGISYSNDLAIKHSLDTRQVMESDWYHRLFPTTRLSTKKNTQAEITTSRGGGRLATSVNGTLTGLGGTLFIIDDPQKPTEVLSDTQRESTNNWAGGTLMTRLDDVQTSCIILVQQRLHEEDMSGTLLIRGGWTHLNLPAIAEKDEAIAIGSDVCHIRKVGDPLQPERQDLETLNQIKADIGSYWFAAQYQQRPAPVGGGLVKWEYFQFFDNAPSVKEGDLIVQSWDMATTVSDSADWSVGITALLRGGSYYILHVQRQREEYPMLKRRILHEARRLHANAVLIEAIGAGESMVQDLRYESRDRPLNIVPIKPKLDKVTRMYTETPAIEAKRVLLPRSAPWLADFQHEITSFPKGAHDDQVDALSQLLAWGRQREQHRPAQWQVFTIQAAPRLTVNDLFTMRTW